jgi:biotin operon repressor
MTTSSRLLALLSMLQARRDWPGQLLAERLGVSPRTVRRDVDRLREMDYRITATKGPDGGYRLDAGSELPPLVFDDGNTASTADLPWPSGEGRCARLRPCAALSLPSDLPFDRDNSGSLGWRWSRRLP